MRRGHPRVWRNEGPRHFNPRGPGPGFGPPRNYGPPILETPSFSNSPFSRPLFRGHTPGHHPSDAEHSPFGRRPNLDQTTFIRRSTDEPFSRRSTDEPFIRRSTDEPFDRRPLEEPQPYSRRTIDENPHFNRRPFPTRGNNYRIDRREPREPYNNDRYRVNSMGDIDHRNFPAQNEQNYSKHPISPWAHDIVFDRNIHDRDQRNYRFEEPSHETQRHPEHTGHRPPASDHYEGQTASNVEIAESFSRSVDDTVDIVRRKLMHRSDPQNYPLETDLSQPQQTNALDEPTNYPALEKDMESHSTKKKAKPKRNIKTDCDKIKTKIVHQLFKMDKDRMHKLMDNPSSSNKFEFAIKSLITESQNSMNRHLRSTAEKSLYGASNDLSQFNSENDAIYEDTFMRQLEGILDPQDTIILEDIKPIVLAELNKVLHLDNFDGAFESDVYNNEYAEQVTETYSNNHETFEQCPQESYVDNNHDIDQCDAPPPINTPHAYDPLSPENTSFNSKSQDSQDSFCQNFAANDNQLKKEQETYSNMINESYDDLTPSASSYSNRPSNENQPNTDAETSQTEDPKNTTENGNFFDANARFSDDDEYTFAELDKQYHVAVDCNYIMDDLDTKITSSNMQRASPPRSPTRPQETLKKHLKPIPLAALRDLDPPTMKENIIKEELLSNDFYQQPKETTKKGNKSCNAHDEELPKPDSSSTDSPEKSKSRKRSSEKVTLHRKEKRKRSESPTDTNKKILNKNIIINLTDCVKKSEKCEASGKSVFNLFFSKEQRGDDKRESKKSDRPESAHSYKYSKKKEKNFKSKASNPKKNRTMSTSSNHSAKSPSENNSSLNTGNPSNKKFIPIDIFSKSLPTSTSTVKTVAPKSISKQVTRRHVATQCLQKGHSKETQTSLSKSSTSRFCQTERRGLSVKFVQTDPISFNKPAIKATDAFERMKEIDIEIQALVQEKFKLYNSIESKESRNNMDLGMTVLNMPADEMEHKPETPTAADMIIEDFTNISAEELEEIALESVKPTFSKISNIRRSSITKNSHKKKSPKKNVNKNNAGANDAPNISLLEQIITDDRPLEDIISLDELEDLPLKERNKKNVLLNKKSQITTKHSSNKNARPEKRKFVTFDLTGHNEAALPEDIMPIEELFKLYDIKPCSVVLLRKHYDDYRLSKKTVPENAKESKSKLSKAPSEEKSLVKRMRHTSPSRKLQSKESQVKRKTTSRSKPYVSKEFIVDSDDDIEEVKIKEKPKKKVELKEKEETKEKKEKKEKRVKVKEDEKVSEAVVEEIIEEAVINEIHFQDDMLDVSEDIVIGEAIVEDAAAKVVSHAALNTSDEIVIDNSQSEDDNPPESGDRQSAVVCKMYDFSADEDLKHEAVALQGNGDAVLAIECIDNNFLAASLDGNVYYYSSEGKLLNTLRGSNLAVTCLAIVRESYGTTVYTGSLDSRIRSYDLETYTEKGPECNVLSPIQSMDCAWGTVFVGTRTGFVLQFECKNHMLIPVSTIKFSGQSILALRALKEGPRKVLLVAPRSENVTIKDAQTGLLLRSLVGPKMTVYTLLYEDSKVFCGTSSNQIQVFDYASGSHIGEHEGGKGAVCLRSAGGLIFAGCYDGCVYVFKPGDAKPFAQLRGPTMLLLSLAVVGGKIIVGYKDRSLYIWKIPQNILKEMIL